MLSIIIPVYNEKSSIIEVINQLNKLPIEIEIIIVNDGSTDGTEDLLNEYSNSYKNKNLKLIHMSKNAGKGSAIREGIKFINGDYAVIQDADLEYNTSNLVEMYKIATNNNWDVLYGNRFATNNYFFRMNPLNLLGNRFILPLLSSILYTQYIPDEATCYKMFRSTIIKGIPLKCVRFDFCPEITAKVRRKGYYIHFIPIDYEPRTTNEGKKLRVIKDGIDTINKLIKFRFGRI